ncbi:hypothetical protein BJF88_06140 [Cellulosimicrobium sp. CUA-896]|nr:hypothetical protein BJF88_06140 [Cellulosimicrobium sp. CUA-896]
MVVLAGLAAIARPSTSSTPLAPDNPAPGGARAVAEVLRDRGVDVTYVRGVSDAVAAADAGSTLLVTESSYLLDEQVDALVAAPADLVLLSPTERMLAAATGGAAELAYDWSDGGTVRSPQCDDPSAQAAGALRSDGVGFRLAGTADAALCFPSPGGPQVGAYLVHEADGRTVRAIDTTAVLSNGTVAEDGNAALALWALGADERLVWLVQDPFDTSVPGGQEDPAVALPPWTGVVALQLLVVVLVVALWRGRRLGALVTEDLPVVVRASETTRGRGRLYRRAGSRGHAAAGLRASTADRLAARLGLPRSADAASLVDAVARATDRPTDQVAQLLYGPPPVDDAALLELARHLDQIESEVYHS